MKEESFMMEMCCDEYLVSKKRKEKAFDKILLQRDSTDC